MKTLIFMDSLSDRIPYLKQIPIWVWFLIVGLTVLLRFYILAAALTIGLLITFIVLFIIGMIAFAEATDKT